MDIPNNCFLLSCFVLAGVFTSHCLHHFNGEWTWSGNGASKTYLNLQVIPEVSVVMFLESSFAFGTAEILALVD